MCTVNRSSLRMNVFQLFVTHTVKKTEQQRQWSSMKTDSKQHMFEFINEKFLVLWESVLREDDDFTTRVRKCLRIIVAFSIWPTLAIAGYWWWVAVAQHYLRSDTPGWPLTLTLIAVAGTLSAAFSLTVFSKDNSDATGWRTTIIMVAPLAWVIAGTICLPTFPAEPFCFIMAALSLILFPPSRDGELCARDIRGVISCLCFAVCGGLHMHNQHAMACSVPCPNGTDAHAPGDSNQHMLCALFRASARASRRRRLRS